MLNYHHPVVQADMKELAAQPLPWQVLHDRTVLVTGANGMLATYLVYFLHYLNRVCGIRVRTVALSRNVERMHTLFAGLEGTDATELLVQDICRPLPPGARADYILHLAGNASPHFIRTTPADILLTNLEGTVRVLDAARAWNSRVLFVSTREVYGAVTGRELLGETDFGSVDPAEPRSCYPESKRAAEALLVAYGRQYGVCANAVRMAHAYGPGMKLAGDGRVMADFMAAAVEGRPIVLHSTGEAERAFCYLTDAVAGLLTVLLKAPAGEAYNLANEREPMPIKEVARLVAGVDPVRPLEVRIELPAEQDTAYCNYKRVGLDTAKLEALGWQPRVSLREGILRTWKVAVPDEPLDG